MDIWTGGTGGNICPFSDVSFCSTLSDLRELTKRMASPEVLHNYLEMSGAYAIWLPQNQIMAAFCGDPIAYDEFQNICIATSYCQMNIVAVPNPKMHISYTLEPV